MAGHVVPRGTPAAVVRTPNTAQCETVPALRHEIEKRGPGFVASTPDGAAALQQAELECLGRLVRQLGLTAQQGNRPRVSPRVGVVGCSAGIDHSRARLPDASTTGRRTGVYQSGVALREDIRPATACNASTVARMQPAGNSVSHQA